MAGRKFATAGSLLLLEWILAGAAWAAAEEWRVPDAELRFTLELASRPQPAACGYWVSLPDGGVLPGRVPTPAAFAPTGSGTAKAGAPGGELESRLLWHQRATAASVVFADPGPSVTRVHLYVSGSATPRLWTPDSPLKPSALLATAPAAKADLRTARDLARLGEVSPSFHAIQKSGIPIAPLSIGGDESGRPKPASFYLLSHVITTDPGKTWIAPFTIDGETLVLVNGQELKPEKRIDKWGGTGTWFDLPPGLNRVEVFQTAPGTGAYGDDRRGGGLMYLTWRTPHATLDELGGARSNKVPMTGTSRMETRVLKIEEIARSGEARIVGVESKTGGPVACARVRPVQVFWVGDEPPLIVCELEALTEGNPADTVYTWDFGGQGRVQGAKVPWILPGLKEHPIKLTAQAGAQSSQSVTPYFAYAPLSTDLSDPAAREDFRKALAQMLQAQVSGPDPVRDWDPSIWNHLIRTLELGQGFELLQNLVGQRRGLLRQAIPPEQRIAIEDVYLDMLQPRDPRKALELVEAIARESSGSRLEDLFLRKFEIQMHYLGARDEAGAGLQRLAEKAQGEIKEWLTIRLGDVAFLAGDLNKATACYSEVERRAREERNRETGTPLDQLVTEGLLPEKSRAPEPPAKPERGRKKGRGQGVPEEAPQTPAPAPSAPETPPAPRPGPGSWGIDALLDVNLSENVATLISDGYFLEAKEALRRWERKYPLSKISGDYVLQEARFCMALQDWRRARSLLEAYCRAVDASSFLPEAARLLVVCARELRIPPQETREVLESVKGNLQYHPVAGELEAYLSGRPADGK